MSNGNAPSGFRPVQNQGTGGYTGKTVAMAVAADDTNAIGIGTPVKLTGSSVDNGKYPVVTLAAPGDANLPTDLVGAVVRVNFIAGDMESTYRPAGAQVAYRLVFVPEDRFCVYSVQENSTPTALDPATVLGSNINFTAESVDPVTGSSSVQLDSATVDSTDTLPWRILEAENQVTNVSDGTEPNTRWLVRLNNSANNNTTGVAG